MANTGQDSDAAFFNLMHHFLATSHKADGGASREDSPANRRFEARRPFRITQRIAPGYCWEVPPESAWIEVPCYDLAQAGFSFLLDEKPSFERLVAMFRAADPICVAARVNHWRPVLLDAWGGVVQPAISSIGAVQHAGRTEAKILVGCQFLRRFTA